MSSTRKEFLSEVVEAYDAQRDRFEKMAREVARICEELLRQHGIRGNVQWRAKDPERLFAKIQNAKFAEIDTVRDMISRIGDLSAARITTYVETDRAKVVAKLKDQFHLVGEPDIKDGKSKSKFYRATHVQVQLHEPEGAFANLKDVSCEIQVCSMLAHVYNEIEHDLGYKPFAGDLAKAEVESLDAIGNIVSAGDTLIVHAIQRVEERTQNESEPFTDVHDFISRMRSMVPSAGSFADNAGPLFELLMTLGATSPNDIQTRFLESDTDPAALLERLEEYLGARHLVEEVNVRYLPEPDTSDLLMVKVVASQDSDLRRWLEHAPQGRPGRLRYLARALDTMLKEGG